MLIRGPLVTSDVEHLFVYPLAIGTLQAGKRFSIAGSCKNVSSSTSPVLIGFFRVCVFAVDNHMFMYEVLSLLIPHAVEVALPCGHSANVRFGKKHLTVEMSNTI